MGRKNQQSRSSRRMKKKDAAPESETVRKPRRELKGRKARSPTRLETEKAGAIITSLTTETTESFVNITKKQAVRVSIDAPESDSKQSDVLEPNATKLPMTTHQRGGRLQRIEGPGAIPVDGIDSGVTNHENDQQFGRDSDASFLLTPFEAVTVPPKPVMATVLGTLEASNVTDGDSEGKRLTFCSFLVALLCIASVVLAAIVVSIQLGAGEKSSTVVAPPPTLTHPTGSPTLTPTLSPRRKIHDQAELIEAVDEYMLLSTEDRTNAVRKIEYWDVSAITDMSHVFSGQRFPVMRAFNEDVSRWDVSSVVDMNGVFFRADYFNQNLSTWNVGKVTSMNGMFYANRNFHGDVSTWDTQKVTDMDNMFADTNLFNGDVSSWDVSNVQSMESMFRGALSFDQDLSKWQVGRLTNAAKMFRSTLALGDHDLSAWDVSNVRDFEAMFSGSIFNGNITAWNTSNAESMRRMFGSAVNFNQDLSRWNVGRVTSMHKMFHETRSYNSPLSWKSTSLIDVREMFSGASRFNQIVTLDVSKVADFTAVFENATSFNRDVSHWNVSNAVFLKNMFKLAASFNQPLDEWDVSRVEVMDRMFDHATAFNGDIGAWQTRSLVSANEMFSGASSFDRDLSRWNVSKLTSAVSFLADAHLFNHSLCDWARILPPDVDLGNAFDGAMCHGFDEPKAGVSFCMSCQ